MSQRALAKRVGVGSHASFVDYERGRRLPPEDVLVACDRVLELDDGALVRLRKAALEKRADARADAPRAGQDASVPILRRRSTRGWLAAALAAVLLAGGAIALRQATSHHGAPPAARAQTRFGFETPAGTWYVLWGRQKARGEITDRLHYEGTHAYRVDMAGASEGHGGTNGYVAFGIAHGVETLHSGARVTMHLWSNHAGDGVRLFVYGPSSQIVWAAETATSASELPLTGAPARWTTITWTVPPVSQVNGIGIQPLQPDDAPRTIAVDSVSW
jgi:transcriptional regulator with XRE-family HTH domain